MKLFKISLLSIFALNIYLLFNHLWMFITLMIAGVIGTILLIKYSSAWEK
jgi:hypothetical protein